MFSFYVFLILVSEGALRLLFHVKDTVNPENAVGPYEPRAYLPAYEGAEFDPVAMCRATEFNSADPAALRIGMVGGSMTWGMGVPDLMGWTKNRPRATTRGRIFEEPLLETT